MISNNYYQHFKDQYKNQILIFKSDNQYIIAKEDIEKAKPLELPTSEIDGEKVIMINKDKSLNPYYSGMPTLTAFFIQVYISTI